LEELGGGLEKKVGHSPIRCHFILFLRSLLSFCLNKVHSLRQNGSWDSPGYYLQQCWPYGRHGALWSALFHQVWIWQRWFLLVFFFLFADNHIVTTITVNNDPFSPTCIMICLQMCCLTINLLHHAGIHEEMLVSAFKSNQTHFPSQWI